MIKLELASVTALPGVIPPQHRSPGNGHGDGMAAEKDQATRCQDGSEKRKCGEGKRKETRYKESFLLSRNTQVRALCSIPRREQ